MTGAILLYAVEGSLFLIMAGIALGFLRLVLGPTLADRVVALDMMTVSIVAFCALFAIKSGTPVFLDVAMVLALIGFLTTAALARYAERRMKRSSLDTLPSAADQLQAMARKRQTKDEPGKDPRDD
ncbi:MAG: monovalent cation/H+ antiporter complex subunit F [Qingshengfaniella sp.]